LSGLFVKAGTTGKRGISRISEGGELRSQVNVDWKQLASMCVVFTAIVGAVLWLGGRVYFSLSKGEANSIAIIDLEEDTDDDITAIVSRQMRAWTIINKMRESLSEVKTGQRLIQKDVENILVILRGSSSPRAYRTPRED